MRARLLSIPVAQLSIDPGGFSWQQVPFIGSCDLVHAPSTEGVAGTESPHAMKVASVSLLISSCLLLCLLVCGSYVQVLLVVGGVFNSTVTVVAMDVRTEHAQDCSQVSECVGVKCLWELGELQN